MYVVCKILIVFVVFLNFIIFNIVVMKNTKYFFAFFIILMGFSSFAQTDKIKQTAAQEEMGQALKHWFNSGSTIVDGKVEKVSWVTTNASSDEGYYCCKFKIERILKGSLNTGYLNLKVKGPHFLMVGDSADDIHGGGRYILKIQKSDFKAEAYQTENSGVYIAPNEHLIFDKGSRRNEIGFTEKINGITVVYKDEAALDKALQEYCGVKVEKKSPVLSKQQINEELYQQKVKKRAEIMQILQSRLQKRNAYLQNKVSNTSGADTILNITAANPSYNNSSGKQYYVFDILVSSTGTSTYLDNALINFTYNSVAFGTHAVLNNKVQVILGPAFNNSTYYNPQSTLDDGIDSIGIAFSTDFTGTSWNRTLITSTPVVLTIIFVHGCFWHGHHCNSGKLPSTRIEFWKSKIEGNIIRDKKTIDALKKDNWNVIVVWQCQIKNKLIREEKLNSLIAKIKNTHRSL